MTIIDMAKAHLESVKSAINELYSQKQKVEQEIENLSNYVSKCQAIILDSEHVNNQSSSNVDNVENSNFTLGGRS